MLKTAKSWYAIGVMQSYRQNFCYKLFFLLMPLLGMDGDAPGLKVLLDRQVVDFDASTVRASNALLAMASDCGSDTVFIPQYDVQKDALRLLRAIQDGKELSVDSLQGIFRVAALFNYLDHDELPGLLDRIRSIMSDPLKLEHTMQFLQYCDVAHHPYNDLLYEIRRRLMREPMQHVRYAARATIAYHNQLGHRLDSTFIYNVAISANGRRRVYTCQGLRDDMLAICDEGDDLPSVMYPSLPRANSCWLSPDGLYVLVANEAQIKGYTLERSQPALYFHPPDVSHCMEKEGRIVQGCFTQDGRHFCLSRVGSITMYDAQSHDEQWSLAVAGNNVFSLYPKNPAIIAVLCIDEGKQAFTVWDARAKKKLYMQSLGDAKDISFSANGRELIVVNSRGQLRFFDTVTGQHLGTRQLPAELMNPQIFAHAGIVVDNKGSELFVYSLLDGTRLYSRQFYRDCRGVAVSQDGARMAMALQDFESTMPYITGKYTAVGACITHGCGINWQALCKKMTLAEAAFLVAYFKMPWHEKAMLFEWWNYDAKELRDYYLTGPNMKAVEELVVVPWYYRLLGMLHNNY